jgi:hypothetical protein
MALLLLALSGCCSAATAGAASAGADEAPLLWRQGHETLLIEPWGLDGIRVRGTLGRSVGEMPFGAQLPLADAAKCSRPTRRVDASSSGSSAAPNASIV